MKMNSWDSANMQLLAELKMIFPEIAEQEIYDCIVKNSKDKEACIKFLRRLNEDYLFGCQSPITTASLKERFNKLGINDELTERNDSKETLDSELDIYIPGETLNYTFLLNEEKSINLKDSNKTFLQETDDTNKAQSQAACGKGTIHSAPVVTSTSSPFGLMDNGNVFSASSQTELPPTTDITQLSTQNSYFSKDMLKWNNNCNEVPLQLPRLNYSRGFSYPIPDPITAHLQNIPYPSLPQSTFYHYNQLKAKDFTKPLYVSVASPQQYLSPYITSLPSIGLLSSSPADSQRRHSPISSHLTTSYSSPLSAVLPPSSLSSSVSHIPTFPYPSTICPPHQQQLSTKSSHSPAYGYEHHVTEDQHRERIGVKSANPFQPTYELFPKQDFTSRTYSTNLAATLDQYSSHTTHQLSSFLSNTSHTKPEENNEVGYVKALLPYQMNNYKLILEELCKMKNLRYTLRQDVSSREQELSQIRQRQKFPNMEQIQKLKEEIIKLRVERDCLTMELDFHVKGQESSNTIEENFYENIFTGPKGPIPPVPNRTAQNSFAEHRDEDDQRNKWSCRKCTYANHPDLIDCEICESPRVMIIPD